MKKMQLVSNNKNHWQHALRWGAFCWMVLLLTGHSDGFPGSDSLLFEIPMTDDSSSLFHISREAAIRDMLMGPMVIEDGNLLFYSTRGYAIYKKDGSLIESTSFIDEKRKSGEFSVAFPLDGGEVILLSTEEPAGVYVKKIGRGRPRKLDADEKGVIEAARKGTLLNLLFNTRLSEMVTAHELMPGLVAFDHPFEVQHQWWSLDRRFSAGSPVIESGSGRQGVLFPGIKGLDQSTIFRHVLEPHQIVDGSGRNRYYGLKAQTGWDSASYRQELYHCDYAGNILFVDTFPKQSIRETIIEESRNKEYTFERTALWAFPPSVDRNGDIYYGALDFQTNRLTVRQRTYHRRAPRDSEQLLDSLLDIEGRIRFKPLSLGCDRSSAGGKSIPDVSMVTEKGDTVKAQSWDLSRDGFLVRISRSQYRDINAKLARPAVHLPDEIKKVQESLLQNPTSWCPYSISVTGRKGNVREFDYGAGEEIICARIINRTVTDRLIIRVDLTDYAEILILGIEGECSDRFQFNRQLFQSRQDIVAADTLGRIVEKDFEHDPGSPRYLEWR